MRAFKIAAWVLGGLLALIVVAAVAIYVSIDPNDYRDAIARRVQQSTGRPLKIAGELDLKLFPWLALQVNDVSMGNPPGYGTEPFLTVGHADVGVRLLPLLHKRIEVRRVTLEGLTINLASRGQDDNNWKDLTDSDKPKQPDSGPASQARIAGLDVQHGTLLYRDQEKKSLTRLSHIDLHTGALAGTEPIPVRMQFDYDDGTAGSAMHFETEAQLRMPGGGSRLELNELVVKSGKLAVRARALALDIETETLAPTTLQLNFGELPLELTAAGEKLFGARVVTGKVATRHASLRRLLPSMGIEVPNTRDPHVLAAMALQSDYRLTQNALQLTGLDLNLDDTRIRGSLAVDDLESKALAFDLAVDSINVDRYREPETKSAGGKKDGAPTALPLEALRKLNAHGVLRIGRATFADLKFNDLRLPVEAAAGRVLLNPQAKLFGGRYDGDIMFDARPQTAQLSLNERLRGIDIGALVNAVFDTTRVTGRGDATAVLKGAGNTDAAIVASLAGKIDANVKDGAFNGVDLWYELRRAPSRCAPRSRLLPAAPHWPTACCATTTCASIWIISR